MIADGPKEFRKKFLPYCILRHEDGCYVILNRDGENLGPAGHYKVKGLGPSVARKLSWQSSHDVGRIYFYNDGCIPTRSPAFMAAYQEKLAVFAKLTATRLRCPNYEEHAPNKPKVEFRPPPPRRHGEITL